MRRMREPRGSPTPRPPAACAPRSAALARLQRRAQTPPHASAPPCGVAGGGGWDAEVSRGGLSGRRPPPGKGEEEEEEKEKEDEEEEGKGRRRGGGRML